MVEGTCVDGDRTELQQISEHLAELAGDGHVQIDNEYQSFYDTDYCNDLPVIASAGSTMTGKRLH